MRAVRTLLIRRGLSELGLTQEEIEHVKRLALRLDALGNLFARGYAVEPPDIQRRFVHGLKFFQDSLVFGNGKPLPKAWFTRVHAVGNVQIRVGNERDGSMMVLVNLPKGLLRVRGFFNRRAIEIRLNESELRYIRERLSEGGEAKFVRVWVDKKDRFCVAITFEREVVPIQTSDYALVIDVNSWRYGVWWWLVRGGKIVSRSVERPDLGYVERLYGEMLRTEREYGKLKRLGFDKTPEGKRLRKLGRNLRRRLFAYLKNFANETTHRLIRKALRKRAKIVVDYVIEESRRELLEEKLPSSLIKLYLAYLPRFVELLEAQAKWYGLPIEFRRLPSTVCPICGGELRHIGNRVMACEKCGFKANRDEVPIRWYIKISTNH